MTTTIDVPAAAPVAAPQRVPVARGYRFELVKLVSQWRVRLLFIVSWIVPAIVVVGVAKQGTLPSDTPFGRWLHATGWAAPLVGLGFAGMYVLPLLTSVVAGDVFAAEDRLGTWRHLLVAIRSPRRIFAAKALASLTVIVALVVGLPCSSAAAGVLVVGDRPLIGMDGHVLAPADAAGKVFLAWACALAPTLALAAIGLLGSVILGRSPIGLLLPAIVGLGMQGMQILPIPVALRLALPGYAFIAWHGLFTSPMQLGPLLISVVVSLVWAAAATALAYRSFMRRDFTSPSYDGGGRRILLAGIVPMAVVLVLTLGIVAIAAPRTTGSGIEQTKVQDSLATSFAHLYRVQTQQLHRPDVTEAQLRTTAACDKGGGLEENSGPGNGWRCTVTWHLPGVEAVGQAVYQLDVTADGKYIADGDGPREVNGYFLVRTPTGDAANPLWQFDGTVDLLKTAPKG
jgi:ABC-2 type transport system permease protein